MRGDLRRRNGQEIHRPMLKISTGKDAFNPLTAEWAPRALIDFTLSNARRFYSSMGKPLDGKGLTELAALFETWLQVRCWPHWWQKFAVEGHSIPQRVERGGGWSRWQKSPEFRSMEVGTSDTAAMLINQSTYAACIRENQDLKLSDSELY